MKASGKRFFAAALGQIKQQHYSTIEKLAGTTNIAQGTLSRFMTGKHHPDGKNFAQLCRTLPAEQAATLLEAYLRDHIPDGRDHLVRLCAAPEGQPEDHNIIADELPHAARVLLYDLSNLLVAHPETFDAFAANVRLTRELYARLEKQRGQEDAPRQKKNSADSN